MAKEQVALVYGRIPLSEDSTSGRWETVGRVVLEEFCRNMDYTVAGIYLDVGTAAPCKSRPEFRRMMMAAKPGDVIVVYKLSRLTLSVVGLVDLLRDFDRRHLRLKVVTQPFVTPATPGPVMVTVLNESAEWERTLREAGP